MRMTRLVLAAALAGLAGPIAAQPADAPPRGGFGPGLASEALARLPQTPGAKGDQERHYFFAEAGKEMPYRLYVPQSYDPKVAAPLVVALHGYGGNQDYFFALVDDLQSLCDRYGFIFLAPMGYSTGNWYGAPMDVPGGSPPGADGRPLPRPRGLPAGPPDGPRERQLSETDVLNVLRIVRGQYNVDPHRIYLMGHSMGGAGAWSLALKHPEIWAAVAPMSGTLSEADYDYSRVAKLPMMVAVGGTETEFGLVDSSKAEVSAMRAAGMDPAYLEIEGGAHMSMIPQAVPKVLAFFAQQRRR